MNTVQVELKGIEMSENTLSAPSTLADFVQATAEEFFVPGISVAVWANGEEAFASHGVTSVDNPLPVTPDTLFALGSISKSFTFSALMCLVADGRVDLDAPVRRYVPELELPDEEVAAEITVLQLLNHTAGLDWRIVGDTGAGDGALALQVARLAELKVIGQPGERSSYSQEGYNLLGRVIEKVTGLTFEQAVAALLLDPIGLPNSTYSLDQIITRRFALGHNYDENGSPVVARQWKDTRGNNPGGGLASTAVDQLRWARFHLGDGTAPDGTRVLPAELMRRMQEPTVELRGTTLGDAMGIGWFLRDVDGVRTVGHGGSGNGQFSELLVVPERDFAIVTLNNAGPVGVPCNQAIVRWALEHYLGVVDSDPEPLPYDEVRAQAVVGSYANDAMTFDVAADGEGEGGGDGSGLTLQVRIKAEIRAASEVELPADYEPFSFGLLADDQYIVTGGALKGQRGFFTRDASGAVVGVDLAGRLFERVATDASES